MDSQSEERGPITIENGVLGIRAEHGRYVYAPITACSVGPHPQNPLASLITMPGRVFEVMGHPDSIAADIFGHKAKPATPAPEIIKP